MFCFAVYISCSNWYTVALRCVRNVRCNGRLRPVNQVMNVPVFVVRVYIKAAILCNCDLQLRVSTSTIVLKYMDIRLKCGPIDTKGLC